MAKITITNGTYRNTPVNGIFELVKDYQEGAKGGFVTVINDGSVEAAQKGAKIRVKVEADNIEVTGELAADYHAPNSNPKTHEPELVETDEETIARITTTFNYIETLAAAAQRAQITGLIISGPAGVGKSYGVERQLEKMNLTRTLKGLPENYEIITGGTSAIGLYLKLWDNRKEGQVLVFDDCDTALTDELQLNMLKAALDTKKRRKICWMKESKALNIKDPQTGKTYDKIPNAFTYEGTIIFITNLKFDRCRIGKLTEHLKAIMSRVHYLDLCLDTLREQKLRVQQVVEAGMLDNHDLPETTKDAVVKYVFDNIEYLTEFSLRTVLKVADLAAIHADPVRWMEMADMTVLSHKGRIQKAIAKRKEVAA
jgi:hypothetical protein